MFACHQILTLSELSEQGIMSYSQVFSLLLSLLLKLANNFGAILTCKYGYSEVYCIKQ